MGIITDTNEHERFCKKDGWELVPNARRHKKYRKKLSDGTVLQTSISHGYKEYSRKLSDGILKEQLRVTEDYYLKMIGKRK